MYHRSNTNDEIIKNDMRACGFPDVIDGSFYLVNDKNAYTQSVLCLEQKGYRGPSGEEGICSVKFFTNTEACQKYLRQK